MWDAVKHWETISRDHPTDLHALKFAYEIHFYLGNSAGIRDCVQKVHS